MDNIIYESRNGKMIKVGTPRRPDRDNFLIICQYGDWSGFRTLVNCERQIPELENNLAMNSGRAYAIVER
jgi:hypothetical protein